MYGFNSVTKRCGSGGGSRLEKNSSPATSTNMNNTADHNVVKKSTWKELEITGTICNLSPHLWQLQHLTSLYLNNNNLSRLPPDIARLHNLVCLDISSNKLRSLPSAIGEIITLKELHVNNNCIRILPYELGKLFQLHVLGLKGNPLPSDILNMYNEPSGTQRLLTYLLDNLNESRICSKEISQSKEGPTLTCFDLGLVLTIEMDMTISIEVAMVRVTGYGKETEYDSGAA